MKIKKLNTIIAFIAKAKKLTVLFKSIKVLKLAFSLATVALFAACYAPGLGWALAAVITGLILIHEFGHMIAIARIGLGWKLPVFIPFLGAALFLPPTDRKKEAYTGIGGPILGTLGAMACFIPYVLYGSKFWASAAFFGLFINLFNLIPLSPLDGGRVLQAVHPMLKWLGWVLLIGYTFVVGEPGMLIFWILCITDVSSLSRRVRANFIWLIWALMFILTVFGIRAHTNASNVGNWVDAVIGLLFAVLFEFSSRYGADWDNRDERPMPELQDRWAFLGCYAILVLSLVTAMITVSQIIR